MPSRLDFLHSLSRSHEREELVLDPNTLFQVTGSEFVHVSSLKLSPDHHMLAFTVDSVGNEDYSGWVKDLRTGNQVQLPELSSVVSVEWGDVSDAGAAGAASGAHEEYALYFTKPDALRRPHQVCSSC